jgi:uncharacterized membrane protein YqjE
MWLKCGWCVDTGTVCGAVGQLLYAETLSRKIQLFCFVLLHVLIALYYGIPDSQYYLCPAHVYTCSLYVMASAACVLIMFAASANELC